MAKTRVCLVILLWRASRPGSNKREGQDVFIEGISYKIGHTVQVQLSIGGCGLMRKEQA